PRPDTGSRSPAPRPPAPRPDRPDTPAPRDWPMRSSRHVWRWPSPRSPRAPPAALARSHRALRSKRIDRRGLQRLRPRKRESAKTRKERSHRWTQMDTDRKPSDSSVSICVHLWLHSDVFFALSYFRAFAISIHPFLRPPSTTGGLYLDQRLDGRGVARYT